MDLMSQLAGTKKIFLEIQEEAEAVSIRGDEELLVRALTNLVDNSIKVRSAQKQRPGSAANV